MEQDIQEDYKRAREYILCYRAKRRAYEAAKEEELSALHGAGHGIAPGKPTESLAVRSAAYDEEHAEEYTWLAAVAEMQAHLGRRKHAFLEARRWAETKRYGKGWIALTQTRYGELLPNGFIGYHTARLWWQEMIHSVVVLHAYKI